MFKESNPPTLHCAPLLLLLSGDSICSLLIWAQMYFKSEAFRQSQWRSIIDQLSDISVTVDQEVQGPINAYGSPIGANFRVLCRESAIVKAASASTEYKSKHQSSGKNFGNLFWLDRGIFYQG